jgi:hypothetical protein
VLVHSIAEARLDKREDPLLEYRTDFLRHVRVVRRRSNVADGAENQVEKVALLQV